MAATDLCSIQGYVDDVRTLLLDATQPYRYDDDSIIRGLNLALLEGRRVRPDLFVCRYGNDVPEYQAVTGEIIPIERQFRLAFVYGIAAHTLLRDEEDVQDARANAFRQMFEDMLLGVRQSPMQGGTPSPQKAGGGK